MSDDARAGDRRAVSGRPTGWAVLGPGSIARTFLRDLATTDAALVAVGSADPERARAFAEEAAPLGFAEVTAGGYDDALADPRVDAVYVATVHTGHPRLVLAALEAGKAVLCEKPLAVNHGSAMALADAARRAGVPLVEAYPYRFHPLTRALVELIRDGAIGDVRHVDAAYAFRAAERSGRLFDPEVAGGGILDVGCYPLTLASLVVAAAGSDGAVAEPAELTAVGSLGPTGVDEWSTADLVFPGGITATLRTGVRVQDANELTVLGSRGRLTVPTPWSVSGESTIELAVTDEEPRTLSFTVDGLYAREADAVARLIGTGAVEAPEMTLEESLAAARTSDRWRAAIGLRYAFEAEDADIPTVSGRPLRREPDVEMPYGEIPGVGKRMSRLVMGVDNQPDLAHASALFDRFVESGGTAFDTAYIYGQGELERRLGRWIANRGIRDDVVIITKGAHTPHCDPESLTRQLTESLERQGTDHADIYLMHRDDPDVPVGEFVDVLDEHVRSGRIRVYGFSNWGLDRFDEATAYAEAAGRTAPSVLSNHFGLAEAYDVPWDGCRHATDPASKEWLAERRIPLLPWSSQARGFFARARPGDTSDPELVRCYFSDANFERLARATTLGDELGVPATAIALAYVLAQPFPTFPLFGPRTIGEARSSMRGLTVELTPEQVAWLDLRA